uniref:RNA-binding protein 4 n=1 Tax=Callorhinchus milii TaxID=7868 RepID=V9L759_CALMI
MAGLKTEIAKLVKLTMPTWEEDGVTFTALVTRCNQVDRDQAAKLRAFQMGERRPRDGPTYRRPGNCHKCGKEGHWAKTCRVKTVGKTVGRRREQHGNESDDEDKPRSMIQQFGDLSTKQQKALLAATTKNA